jgi:hypothetical protein
VETTARNRGGRLLASARVDVATSAALIAMKLNAIRQRRGATAIKRGSDAYDMYQLLARLDVDGNIATALVQAPAGLGEWCVEQ